MAGARSSERAAMAGFSREEERSNLPCAVPDAYGEGQMGKQMVAATLTIIMLTVALIRHTPWGGRTSNGRAAVGGKGGFNPDKEIFYLDTFALGLLGQIFGTKQSRDRRRGRERALLPGSPPTATAAIDRASRCRCRKRKRKGCVCVCV
ncbi:hypothetical protein Taro_052763 [Colocasia esculenta]|uniref:Uncharacterized protein n=1 Tax=Colocasia esculenta TaxID=4460 RepID=A0A843XKL4_COLES|nr:hypothetical protein [Colocasia esculenta]